MDEKDRICRSDGHERTTHAVSKRQRCWPELEHGDAYGKRVDMHS